MCPCGHVFLCPSVSVFLHFRDHVPAVSLLTLDSRHQDTLEDTVATFTEPVYIQVSFYKLIDILNLGLIAPKYVY